VIEMGMGDEDVRKRLVADRLEERREMRLVLRARIDERKGLLSPRMKLAVPVKVKGPGLRHTTRFMSGLRISAMP
jgi:hypothetical protein